MTLPSWARPGPPTKEPETLPPALAAGLVKAQRAVKSVHKDSKNPHHNYKYASADDVIEAANDALGAGDLAFSAISTSVVPWEPTGFDTRIDHPPPAELAVHVRYLLIHASGAVWPVESLTPVIPEKGRPWDKALAAAKTFDLAYTLRGLLAIPRGGEDPGAEVDQRDDREWERRRPERQKQIDAKAMEPRRAKQEDPPMEKPLPGAEREIMLARLRRAAEELGNDRCLRLVGKPASYLEVVEAVRVLENEIAQDRAAGAEHGEMFDAARAPTGEAKAVDPTSGPLPPPSSPPKDSGGAAAAIMNASNRAGLKPAQLKSILADKAGVDSPLKVPADKWQTVISAIDALAPAAHAKGVIEQAKRDQEAEEARKRANRP